MKHKMAANAPLRVGSYNIRKCVGLDRRRNPERVLEAMSEVEADIVALQEADLRLGERRTAIPRAYIEKYTDMMPVDLAANDVSLGWHGNAVLVRKGAEVITTKRLDLPGFEPRGAVKVELDYNGRKTRLIATHLGLMRRHRQLQLQAIADHLEECAPMPTIVLGDFNEWSAKKGMEPITGNFDVHAPGRSFHSAQPMAALDRIAVSNHFELKDAGVHERGPALKASDHLPIWADLAYG